ncbi:MAG: hypothetical protein II098_09350 [Treponema sp.]|nr:hypothetical protein [Treponema sp.]
MIKKILVKAAAAALAVGMLSFFSCSDSLNENNNMAYLLASKTAEESVQYGSITISTGDSRALDVSTITSATVTVSGYGMTDVQGTNVNLSNGSGSATISNIPVGNNRVVTVKSNVDGAVIRGVCNVEAKDNNACTVNWASTAIANVYYYLIKANADVSSIESSSFSSKIPSVHASLFNAEQFAADYKAANFNANGLSADDYIAAKGTLKVVSKNAAGYQVQITDIASEKVTLAANGTTTLTGYPGTWKVKVFDSNGNLVEDQVKDVIIGAGKDTTITVEYGTGVDFSDKTIIFVKDSSAPDIWAWETDNGAALTEKAGGAWGTSSDATKMVAVPSDYMADPNGWYMIDYSSKATGKTIKFKLNWSNTEITGKAGTFWYDGSSSSTTNPSPVVSGLVVTVENPQVPVAPTATIAPDSDTISVSGAITVTLTNGNDTISAASVTVSGAASKTYSYSDFSNDVLTIKVSDLGITEADKTITVNASVTNSVKTVTATPKAYTTTPNVVAKNTFTWDNVNCYFVITDRFYNGDTKNDNSYYRKNSNIPDVATFHGGDIVGLTKKLDYFSDLGVNAIWITAPYEQAHGWCSGGKNNNFPHYAFHGYYTQDWTYMDQNMGTIEEFRTFVNEAHKRGIRVVMDVVMNHTGYNTVEDMITYDFGNFKTVPSHGWVSSSSNWGENHTITNYDEQGKWGNWWGCWVRAFSDHPNWASNAGYATGGSGDLTGSLQGLPDVVTERTSSVSIPKFLKTKWAQEPDSTVVPSSTGNTCGNKYGDYKLPTIANVDWYSKSGDWRADNKGAPTDYQVIWLSGWVREFGVDGFRCDTAKHVDKYRWGQLKAACEDALKKWRADSSKEDTAGAKEWTDGFWMTGEAWGWPKESSGDYYGEGKFDSMIDFSFNGSNNWDGNYRTNYPSNSSWSTYIGYNTDSDSDSNGNKNRRLAYISSHDTGLTRVGDQYEVGTGLVLLPGGVQIYYGDESYREKKYSGWGDSDMMTRGDMNWSDGKLTGSVSDKSSNADLVAHWGKVGKFRKYNPAVGAGTGSAYKRSYSGAAGANKVAIGVEGTSVDVSNLFSDGTTVYNWYDGTSATVSSGSVTFNGGSMKTPILVSDRNPADYGVTF